MEDEYWTKLLQSEMESNGEGFKDVVLYVPFPPDGLPWQCVYSEKYVYIAVPDDFYSVLRNPPEAEMLDFARTSAQYE